MDWVLKRWKEIYTEQLQSAADDPEISGRMGNSFPSPFGYDDASNYIRERLLADDAQMLSRAVIIDGRAVGGVDITVREDIYSRSAELVFWISARYRRLGIMSDAVRKMIEKAFETFDIVRIYALPFSDNIPARRVLNNCDFQLEGTLAQAACKNGIMHDCCLYALIKK